MKVTKPYLNGKRVNTRLKTDTVHHYYGCGLQANHDGTMTAVGIIREKTCTNKGQKKAG